MPVSESFSVGIPQSAKTFYHKASNGNVSIMRLATDLNWAQYALKCNRCSAEKYITDKTMLQAVVHPEIDEFCGQHQHNDWVEYKMTIKSSPPPEKESFVEFYNKNKLQPNEGETTGVITISKAEYLTLKGKLPKKAEEPEGRVFRGEEE